MLDSDIVIASGDHPSLDAGISDLLAELRAEPRYFGPSARSNPKPVPSLIDGLEHHDGLRLAAVGRDRVVGLVRVAPSGDVLVAVARGRRNRGIGTALLRAAVEQSAAHGWSRLVLRTSHRSAATRRAAAHVGAVAVDVGRGRVDLIVPVADTGASTSA